MQLAELVSYLDGYLDVRSVPDAPHALNGLQVERSGAVTRLAAAVDLCDATSPLFIARNTGQAEWVRSLGPIVRTTRVGLVRAADFLPVAYLLGVMAMVADGRFRRLGDRVAGTMVVVEERGRVAAPLVLRLLQAHGSLPAGTAVAVAFAASAEPVAAPEPQRHAQTGTHEKHAAATQRVTKHRRPPPDYPASPFPFRLAGGLAPAVRHNGVVSTAMRYLGVPYQWGGASPSAGFDCSGLVTYVFAKLGLSLPHYAAAQYYSPDAVWVSPQRLQPGDLVFFTGSDGTRKEPGHVGIYVDDGYFIDAPHTGSFVRIDSLSEGSYANEYVAAKRIVGGPGFHRRLLHVSKDAAPVAADPLLFPQQMSGPLAGEPLPEIAAVRTAARTSAARSYGLWAGVGLAGLLVLSLGGTLTYRKKKRVAGIEPA